MSTTMPEEVLLAQMVERLLATLTGEEPEDAAVHGPCDRIIGPSGGDPPAEPERSLPVIEGPLPRLRPSCVDPAAETRSG
jgi:hypothetical protein